MAAKFHIHTDQAQVSRCSCNKVNVCEGWCQYFELFIMSPDGVGCAEHQPLKCHNCLYQKHFCYYIIDNQMIIISIGMIIGLKTLKIFPNRTLLFSFYYYHEKLHPLTQLRLQPQIKQIFWSKSNYRKMKVVLITVLLCCCFISILKIHTFVCET